MNHTALNLQGFNQEELTTVQDVLNDLFFTGGVSFNNALCTMSLRLWKMHSLLALSLLPSSM